MNTFQKQQAAKLLATYITPEELQKALDDNDIEKAGEGSRGGKIIGHTKSGKPVYENRNPNHHKGFEDWSKEDHKEAVEHHESKATHLEREASKKFKDGEEDKSAELASQADKHKDVAKHHKTRSED